MISLLVAITLAPTVAVEQLANGATIAAIHMPAAETFSAQTFLRAGSAYESTADSGVSHLLEHLLFVDGEADKVAENAGLLLNATTYREFMRLHTIGPAGSWQQGAEAVARLLRKPSTAGAAAEWSVIAQENALALLDPDEVVHRGIWQSSGSGTPWGHLPMGDTSKPAPAGVDGTFARIAVGPNIVAVVAGGQPVEDVLPELRKLYGALPNGPKLTAPPLPDWKSPRKGAFGSRYGVSAPVAGFDVPAKYLAAEIAVEALSSPARLFSQHLDAKSYLTPSSRGSLAVMSFAPTDGAPDLEMRVARALTVPISDAEFVDAKTRVRLRYSALQPASKGLTTGLSLLFVGRQLDLFGELDRLTKGDVDAIAAEFAK